MKLGIVQFNRISVHTILRDFMLSRLDLMKNMNNSEGACSVNPKPWGWNSYEVLFMWEKQFGPLFSLCVLFSSQLFDFITSFVPSLGCFMDNLNIWFWMDIIVKGWMLACFYVLSPTSAHTLWEHTPQNNSSNLVTPIISCGYIYMT